MTVAPLSHFEQARLAEGPYCETLSIIDRAIQDHAAWSEKWGHIEDFDRHLRGLAYDALLDARMAVVAALPNIARLLAKSDHIAATDEAEDDAAEAVGDRRAA